MDGDGEGEMMPVGRKEAMQCQLRGLKLELRDNADNASSHGGADAMMGRRDVTAES